ncbi:hypothetical protein GGI26_001624 [Coemansia sp. RSA 1358]|nr:hypothetical protein EDC05_001622 [Coemansia umbellata]KAJ2624268.1 hypothetical protein GGI26_001624 [Coemansia sp. RSA 1358]
MLLPTKKASKDESKGHVGNTKQSTTDLLTNVGYIYQSSAGIFTLLPMAQRVIDKIERIVDEEMGRVGGQKLAMPTLLTPDNWIKTGRWESTGEELFTLTDRKEMEMILGPTHEEEITAMVKDMVNSYRRYPLRLYQTTRKFRDEPRPRAGLLRGREFIMKDMYSFDVSKEKAIEAFKALEGAYRRSFSRIGVPYVVADADSGNIGGTLSKEFHFVNESGEDTLLECTDCGYVANEERARGMGTANTGDTAEQDDAVAIDGYYAMIQTNDKELVGARLVAVPSGHKPSVLKISKEWSAAHNHRKQSIVVVHLGSSFKTIDEALTSAAKWHSYQLQQGQTVIIEMDAPLFDSCLQDLRIEDAPDADCDNVAQQQQRTLAAKAKWGDWHVAQMGDGCAECKRGVLKSQRAIEVGHIFYLGDKYSRAMDLNVLYKGKQQCVEMGCYGIGISRILQAAAECCNADKRGLRWPLAIAPYAAVILPLVAAERVSEIYAQLSTIKVGDSEVFQDNVAVDDREHLRPGFRLNDMELLGFPVTVVLGKRFLASEEVEVQLRIPGMQLSNMQSIEGIQVTGDEYECRAHVGLDKLNGFLKLALENHIRPTETVVE